MNKIFMNLLFDKILNFKKVGIHYFGIPLRYQT